MIYRASSLLSDILVREGFVEKTQKLYPGHYDYIKSNGYDPNQSKRYFVLGNRLKVYFNYISIEIIGSIQTKSINVQRYSLTENELKSLIVCINLNASAQKYFLRSIDSILRLGEEYDYISNNPPKFRKTQELKLLEAFKMYNYNYLCSLSNTSTPHKYNYEHIGN